MSMSRRLKKLHTNVEPVLADDEELVAAIVLEKGMKIQHLALVSILLSPILAMIAWLFFRHQSILVTTDKASRHYGTARLRSKHPTKLLGSVGFSTRNALNGSGEIRIAGDTWRVGESWTKEVGQFARAPESAGEPVQLPSRHDDTLARNRRLGLMSTVGAPLAVVALIAVTVVGVQFFDRPNAFALSHQASEQFCGDGNYGDYLAVETDDGPMMVFGFGHRGPARLANVHDDRDDRYADLTRGWKSIKDGVGVVCMTAPPERENLRQVCEQDGAMFTAQRWDPETGTLLRSIRMTSNAIPCDLPAGEHEPSNYMFDQLLCGLVACRLPG